MVNESLYFQKSIMKVTQLKNIKSMQITLDLRFQNLDLEVFYGGEIGEMIVEFS